jgi:hypothetical protein
MTNDRNSRTFVFQSHTCRRIDVRDRVLIAGMKRSSVPTLLTGLHIFVVMGFIAIPVAISGLVSANVLQGAPWLDAGAVRRHPLAGILTLVVLGGLAALSGIVLWASSRKGSVSGRAKVAALLLAVAGLSMTLWTSDLGGAIRHPELSDSAHQTAPRKADSYPVRR